MTYSDDLPEFHNFERTYKTLNIMFINVSKQNLIYNSTSDYYMFTVFACYVIYNIRMIAVATMYSYIKMKQRYSKTTDIYTIRYYITEYLKFYKDTTKSTLQKLRLLAGAVKVSKRRRLITPKNLGFK